MRGKEQVTYKGKVYKRYRAGFSPLDRKDIKGGLQTKDSWSCDCGVSYGTYHNLSCDMETCPICSEQLLGCGHIELFGGKTAPEPRGNPYSKRAFEERLGLKGRGFGTEVVGTLKGMGSDFFVGLKKGFTPPGWKS